MNIARFTALSVFALCVSEAAALPSITGVELYQPAGQRKVKIDYVLSGGPAVVTMDIETNSPSGGWVSIGAGAIYRSGFFPSGDVNKEVPQGEASITWKPEKTWISAAGGFPSARAVLTAWPLDDKPPYMTVDISAGAASADRVRYYQSEEFVPGGVLANTEYRLTKLLFKKVLAKGVTWTMGSIQEHGRFELTEMPHRVTLDGNYYLGVFPVTQRQCQLMYGEDRVGGAETFATDGEMRIRGNVDYHGSQSWSVNVRGLSYYPDAPTEGSILGKLRAMTAQSVDFDLPSEAQWEFACRAGTTEGYWNDGSRIEAVTYQEQDKDGSLPGRYKYNQADSTTVGTSDCGPESGTPIAGSYPPNGWGFYDMHGGVWERCLDWFQEDITSLNGAVNADGANRLDGTVGVNMVIRGGAWCTTASNCRSARRGYAGPSYWGDNREYGFRIACRAGLK